MSFLDKIDSPCFVLEKKKLVQNLSIVDHVQKSSGASFILAFKGFAMWKAFSLLEDVVGSATASSLNEARLCNDKFKTKAHTYAVAYKSDEIDEYCKLSSHLTFNSLSQFEKFKPNVYNYDDLKIGLRVNPLYSDVETAIYNPSSPDSRLGIHPSSLPSKLPPEITGLHFHSLCESDAEATINLLKAIENQCGNHLYHVDWVNIGGGHLLTKKEYDISLLVEGLKSFSEKYDVQLILEPGSAFAWETGFLKTTVLDIISNGDVNIAIIDASFTCHMPDCLEMPYKPKVSLPESPDEKRTTYSYSIGGVSCLAGDVIHDFRFSRPLKVGDTLIFHDMMHYTMVKTNFFNGVDHPSIGMVDDYNKFHLFREFGYEDYKNHLS